MIKTIVDIDLVAYSSINRALEEALSTQSVLELNKQIRSLIHQGLQAINVSPEDALLHGTGDGALLGFDEGPVAYQFAAAVHEACRGWNASRHDAVGLRYFRIGIATGPIEIRNQPDGKEFAGLVIARAVRLEAGCDPGSILIDEDTFVALDKGVRTQFGSPLFVKGKRDEVFTAYSLQIYVPDPKGLARLTGGPESTDGNSYEATLARGATLDRRRRILQIFATLRPHQYDDLIFLLAIPFDQRPPRSQPLVERRGLIFEWVEQEPDGVDILYQDLLTVTGAA